MNLEKTIFEDVVIFTPDVFGDSRGFFVESYNYKRVLEKIGWEQNFIQDNHSFSAKKGTIRGLHYQADPCAQSKIIRVVRGAILDIVVDIRRESKTFGKYFVAELTESNFKQIFVPKGFAHGFCTLTDDVHVCYKVDAYYSAENNRGIIWSDPDLNLPWPTKNPELSNQDMKWPTLRSIFE